MKVIYKKEPSEEARQVLAALQEAVTDELEKKRKLGQYAVFWKNGKVVYEGPGAPSFSE